MKFYKNDSSTELAESPLRRIISDFSNSKVAIIALLIVISLSVMSIFAPFFTYQNPYDLTQLDIMDSVLHPGSQNIQETLYYWLGTDSQGRDVFSAIIYGTRTSLLVSLSSTAIALVLGISMGLIAAYVGGRIDNLIMRIVDLQLSFPAILIALILLAVLGNGIDKVIVALVAVQWAYYARTIRSAALVERRKEYIEAASSLGLSSYRIVFGHLLPNSLPPLIVVATVQVAHAISLEATLSFLGVGTPVTEPSLGRLIKNGFDYMLSGHYWISFFPGIALLMLVVSINLVGDQLRDVLNPRLQK
ncbi:MAG: ABC transporter permease [Arenicella sp.]